jgi:hypothetical protein
MDIPCCEISGDNSDEYDICFSERQMHKILFVLPSFAMQI